jgi:hypothetical protein
MRRSGALGIAAAAALALVTSACAGSNPFTDPTPPPPSGPSQASMQKAYLAMSSGLVAAVNSGTSKINSKTVGPAAVFKPLVTVNVPVFQQFESRTACAGGGYTSVSVTMSGNLTATDTSVFGSIGWSGGESMVGCSDGTWTTNSNPAMTMSGTLNINNSRMSMNIGMGGGWTMSSPGNGTATCQLSGVLMQWDTLTSWSNSGVIICNPGGTFHL